MENVHLARDGLNFNGDLAFGAMHGHANGLCFVVEIWHPGSDEIRPGPVPARAAPDRPDRPGPAGADPGRPSAARAVPAPGRPNAGPVPARKLLIPMQKGLN